MVSGGQNKPTRATKRTSTAPINGKVSRMTVSAKVPGG
jgi:hypothetical protein